MSIILAVLIQILTLPILCHGSDIDEALVMPRIPPDAGSLIYTFLDQLPEWIPTEDVMHYFQRCRAYCYLYSGYRMASSGGLISRQERVVQWCQIQSFKYKAFKLMKNAQSGINVDFHVLNQLSLDWIKHNRLRFVVNAFDQIDTNIIKQLQNLSQKLSPIELSEFELIIVGSQSSLSIHDPEIFQNLGWKVTLLVEERVTIVADRFEGSHDVNLRIIANAKSRKAHWSLQSAIDQHQLSDLMKVDFELHLIVTAQVMQSILEGGDIHFSQMDLLKSVRQIELIFGIQSLTQQQLALFSSKMEQIFRLFEQEAYDGQVTYLVRFDVGIIRMDFQYPHAVLLLKIASSVKSTINVKFLHDQQFSNTQFVPSYICLIALGKLEPFQFVSPFSILQSPWDITKLASELANLPNLLQEHQGNLRLIEDFKLVIKANFVEFKQFLVLLQSIVHGPFKRVELVILKDQLWDFLMKCDYSEAIYQNLDIPDYFELLALSYVSIGQDGTNTMKQSVLLIGDANHAWFLQSEILSLPNVIPEAVDKATMEMAQTSVGDRLTMSFPIVDLIKD
ncbi:hypothetical protein MP228_011435 [Amoeboaphelidium protococcarum]|nr:hypothetical protein MP228_011435 [Amoeboaphelidium protococcarum]